MILFDLKCSKGHIFEAWFADSKNFLKQSKSRSISCPFCHDDNIVKAPMAPNISTGSTDKGKGVDVAIPLGERGGHQERLPNASDSHNRKNPDKNVSRVLQDLSQEVKKLRKFVEDNCTYVGKEFPKEIRKIHYGECSPKNIYGETSKKDAKELVDEGIEFYHLPWFNKRDS